MKKFYFLYLENNSNKVLLECSRHTKTEARYYFQNYYPHLKLDNDGYAKAGNVSYCIAEAFQNGANKG